MHPLPRHFLPRAVVGLIVAALPLLGGVAGASAPTTAARFTTNFTTNASPQQLDAQGYDPSQLAAAYNISPLYGQGITGSGESIALVELDRFNLSDIQQFDAQNNLPDPMIQQNYVGGTPFSLTRSGETTMDLEWAHALAPAARIHIYYLPNHAVNAKSWQELASAENAAVADGATSISLSFGVCGTTPGYKVAQKAFANALAHGVSTFVSSGDDGALAGPPRECGRQPGVAYPASDPSVVSVGGTSLMLAPDNTIQNEVAWNLSGGGKGKPFSRPSWQLTVNLNPGKFRFVPDVAFDADPATGVNVFFRGNWHTAGGTSVGSPAWAAIWAVLQQNAAKAGTPVGPAPALIYYLGNSSSYSQVFNDITEGGNGYYQAVPGWDPVTGWGTPNVAGMANVLQTLPASVRKL